DGLLDRLAAGLRHEQLLSAELSHELRTPLARITAEAELALRRERTSEEYRRVLELVVGNASQLTRTVEALVAAAQQEAGLARGPADVRAAAEAAVEACAGLAQERRVGVTVGPPPGTIRVGVDSEIAERILQPVIENACRYARTSVEVTLR